MLQFAGGPGRPALRLLLLLHDDAEREFDYTAGDGEGASREHDGAERSGISAMTVERIIRVRAPPSVGHVTSSSSAGPGDKSQDHPARVRCDHPPSRHGEREASSQAFRPEVETWDKTASSGRSCRSRTASIRA
jgi:hypothetical protein